MHVHLEVRDFGLVRGADDDTDVAAERVDGAVYCVIVGVARVQVAAGQAPRAITGSGSGDGGGDGCDGDGCDGGDGGGDGAGLYQGFAPSRRSPGEEDKKKLRFFRKSINSR